MVHGVSLGSPPHWDHVKGVDWHERCTTCLTTHSGHTACPSSMASLLLQHLLILAISLHKAFLQVE